MPVSCALKKRKIFNSWDRFVFPYPFNRAIVIVAPPIEVSRDADREQVEQKRLELERTLNRITEEAEAAVAKKE